MDGRGVTNEITFEKIIMLLKYSRDDDDLLKNLPTMVNRDLIDLPLLRCCPSLLASLPIEHLIEPPMF